MTRWRVAATRIMSIGAGLASILLVSSVEARETTQVTMRRAFDALTVLLPQAVTGTLAEYEAADGRIAVALDQLADASAELESHAPEQPEAFGFLSESLARDARAIRRRVESGRFADAEYRIIRMTQTCVACHARLPSHQDAPFATALVDQLDTRTLAPVQVARLELATRQFRRALDRYEAALMDPNVPAAVLDYSGALSDYLIVALRVRAAPKRAAKALSAFAKRRDLTAQLSDSVPSWIKALESLAPELEAEPSIERARTILRQGRELTRQPSDREDLVHRIVAASLLYRLLEQEELTPEQRAEALLLLGESDAFVRRSFERSEAQFHLEQAIRLAPGSWMAREAYRRLEEEILLGYTGSSGLNLPPDVERWLDELRALSMQATPVGATSKKSAS